MTGPRMGMGIEINTELRAELAVVPELITQASEYFAQCATESRDLALHYSLSFTDFLQLDADQLRALHAEWDGTAGEQALEGRLHIGGGSGSEHTRGLLRSLATSLRDLARRDNATLTYPERLTFLRMLETAVLASDPTLFEDYVESQMLVTPEREGKILAESLFRDVDQHDRWIRPHLKRVQLKGGRILVGLQGRESSEPSRIALKWRAARKSAVSVAIFDGAIASGATTLATLSWLSGDAFKLPLNSLVNVHAVHVAPAGARAIIRGGAALGLNVHVYAALSSGVLDDRYYAVDDAGRLELGDVGDIITGDGYHSYERARG